MIYKRIWRERRKVDGAALPFEWTIEGWYLFGFIPLYIRDKETRGTWGEA